uniref:RNase H type-1 domain-containing protein n=1 Tax=Fagus sylvatica TaxID=28930 RepID=A0A2N9HWC0_FAGSY
MRAEAFQVLRRKPVQKGMAVDDVIKLNVDAAIVSNRAAIAVVARNSKGIILNAWVKELMNLDSLVAEASAILWAMELATVEGFGKVTIESDAKKGCEPGSPCLS